jgi:hypothetical protein
MVGTLLRLEELTELQMEEVILQPRQKSYMLSGVHLQELIAL